MPSGRSRIYLMLTLLLSPGMLHLVGQVNTGDVLGTVTDVSAAVIGNAKVTVRNTATGESRTVQTGKTGDYNFSLLQVGTYEVTIEAKDFRTFLTSGLTLSAGDRVRVDAEMEIGAAHQAFRFRPKPLPFCRPTPLPSAR